MNNLICFVLPTCEPDTMKNILIPSLSNILDMREYCTFLINFQKPYTEEDIGYTVNSFNKLGLTVKYTFSEYVWKDKKVPLLKMRNDTSKLEPNAFIYAQLDDDMSFGKTDLDNKDLSGIITFPDGRKEKRYYYPYANWTNCKLTISLQYLNLIYRFLLDDTIGVGVLQGNTDDITKYNTSYMLNPNKVLYYTNRGLIYRNNIKNKNIGMIPDELENLFGGEQDTFCALYRIYQGYNTVVTPLGMCNHLENRKTVGGYEYGWFSINKDLTPGSIAEYINTNYNCNHRQGTPQYCLSNFDDKRYNDYVNNGGIDIPKTDMANQKECIVDLEEIKNKINKIYKEKFKD